MKLITTIVTCLMLFMTMNCEAAYEDGYKATCKLTRKKSDEDKGGVGTGTVCHETEDKYFIITAGHVARRLGCSIYAKFYHSGFESHQMPCRVSYVVNNERSPKYDWAILELDKNIYLKKPYPKPSVIPLAKEEPIQGMVLTSVGCARGCWPTGWIGHLKKMTRNQDGKVVLIYCIPTPIKGRSGSAIMDRECTKIYGVITKLTGICTSSAHIQRSIDIDKVFNMIWADPFEE